MMMKKYFIESKSAIRRLKWKQFSTATPVVLSPTKPHAPEDILLNLPRYMWKGCSDSMEQDFIREVKRSKLAKEAAIEHSMKNYPPFFDSPPIKPEDLKHSDPVAVKNICWNLKYYMPDEAMLKKGRLCPEIDPNMSPAQCYEHCKDIEMVDYIMACIDLGAMKTNENYTPCNLQRDQFFSKFVQTYLDLEELVAGLSLPIDQSSWFFLNRPLVNEEYAQIGLFILAAFFLSVFIVLASYWLIIQTPKTEKLSTYECGFEPYEDAKNRFDVQFYVVAILFVLFDIELLILVPWCLSLSELNLLGFWPAIEFLLELGLGLVYVLCVTRIDR